MRNLRRKISGSNIVILALAVLVYAANAMFTSISTENKGQHERSEFAGSQACISCHRDIYESHIKTAHYFDSRPAAREFIKGSFAKGRNKFVYNKWMEVLLEQEDNGFFQTSFINGTEYEKAPFNVVIGSGRKGQSYLYWNSSKLYQLPVSYFTSLDNWCNSPGFSDNLIKFDRIIGAQCLECHGTYVKYEENQNKETVYDTSKIIYGIDCERCHGPAVEHVKFHKEHPEEKTARYITIINQLGRQQRLDGCALCHSGFRDAIKPAFSFWIGDKLDDFSKARYNNQGMSTLDVHGNQYGLMKSSKCFKMSVEMDCSTCHNPHRNEAESPQLFSLRCMDCHTDTKHASLKLPENKKALLNYNCIDCHMPMLSSQNIILNVSDNNKPVPDQVRTHRIAIYPEKAKEFLNKLK